MSFISSMQHRGVLPDAYVRPCTEGHEPAPRDPQRSVKEGLRFADLGLQKPTCITVQSPDRAGNKLPIPYFYASKPEARDCMPVEDRHGRRSSGRDAK